MGNPLQAKNVIALPRRGEMKRPRRGQVARRVDLAVAQIALIVGFFAHRDKENKGERGNVCHEETY